MDINPDQLEKLLDQLFDDAAKGPSETCRPAACPKCRQSMVKLQDLTKKMGAVCEGESYGEVMLALASMVVTTLQKLEETGANMPLNAALTLKYADRMCQDLLQTIVAINHESD